MALTAVAVSPMTNVFFFAAQGKSLDTLWKVRGMLIAKPHWKKRRVPRKHKFLQCTYFNDRVCARRGLSKSFATGRVIYLLDKIRCWVGGRGCRKKVVWLLTCTELVNSCPLELLLTGGRGFSGELAITRMKLSWERNSGNSDRCRWRRVDIRCKKALALFVLPPLMIQIPFAHSSLPCS